MRLAGSNLLHAVSYIMVVTDGLKFMIIFKVPLLDNLFTQQVMLTSNCVSLTLKL